MATRKQRVLNVTSRPATFRRAGFGFTQATTQLREDQLTEDQINALKNEPNLVVSEAEIDVEDEGETKAKGKK
jgi:Mu-like prophage FluMu N-terminal domain